MRAPSTSCTISRHRLAGRAGTLRCGLSVSTITFTTIGYANVTPLHAGLRLLVGIESFLDAALMALLVAVLARLMIITNHSGRDL